MADDWWTCAVCDKRVARVVAVGGALATPDGRVLSVLLRGGCQDHQQQIGEALVDELMGKGASETTTPSAVRPGQIPGWRRGAERELRAMDSRQARSARPE